MRTLRNLDEKPYVEILSGRWVEKVSSVYRHGALELDLGGIMRAQAKGHGLVASEWRFHLCSDPVKRTTVVPDIAFVSLQRIQGLTDDDIAAPSFAPDVAVEIRSPDDRERDIQEKIALYLAYGSVLVLDVDPARATIAAHARESTTTYQSNECFSHAAAPWLTFDLSRLFQRD